MSYFCIKEKKITVMSFNMEAKKLGWSYWSPPGGDLIKLLVTTGYV